VPRPPRVFLIVAAALLAAAVSVPATARQARALTKRVASPALAGDVRVRVILPPGYTSSRKRYPVVYFLHGLPGSSSSFLGNDWLGGALAAAGRAILVLPQGARDNDSDPEYLNWGSGRNWETYIAREVPRYVDAHFRTIHSRGGRAIIGLSAGGYGATLLGLHHLGTFSVIESWSGYFHPTDPTGTKALARGPATSAHTLIGKLRADARTRPTLLAFYVGRGDARFRYENVQFDRELTADRVAHLFEVYRGGHQTSLWQAHAAGWLRMAVAHLAKPA
jgi:S-formylglutathione hydrolase FrmB